MNHQPFINAILCEPDSDIPRLIYADWLEEHGQGERAEFIRVQVELAKEPLASAVRKLIADEEEGTSHRFMTADESHWYWNAKDLRRREQELLKGNRDETDWIPECVREATIFGGASPEQVASGLKWSRGFIEELACTASDWLQWGKQIVRCQPIERLVFHPEHIIGKEADLWRPFQKPDKHGIRWWAEAALVWARQEPCPECGGPVPVVKSLNDPNLWCARCQGRGFVDFRTLLGKPAPTCTLKPRGLS